MDLGVAGLQRFGNSMPVGPMQRSGEGMGFAGRPEMMPYQPNFAAIEEKLRQRPNTIVTNPPMIGIPRQPSMMPLPLERLAQLQQMGVPGVPPKAKARPKAKAPVKGRRR
jgi:hypothetical protein